MTNPPPPSPPVAEPTPYDRELGAYSDQDREYAKEIADELSLTSADEIDTLVQWLRKHRYESVIADRKRRHITELTQGEIEATQSCLSGFHTQVLDVDAR